MIREIPYRDIVAKIEEGGFPYRFIGDISGTVTGFCSLNRPKDLCLTWIKHPEQKTYDQYRGFKSILIVSPDIVKTSCENASFIVTDRPKALFFYLLDKFWGEKHSCVISDDSIIDSWDIGKNVSIGHHCYIGNEVSISDGTVIEHNVSIIGPVKIGKNCHIHSGVVIGTDGFGYSVDADGVPTKVDHFGGVLVGDNVEIGANTCIDRGTIDNTEIGNNVKIDNLCHIAHNVIIEDNSMIIAEAVICGSAHLHKGCYVAPGGIVKNQMSLGENAYVGLGGVVTGEVEPDTVVVGVPARVLRRVSKDDK